MPFLRPTRTPLPLWWQVLALGVQGCTGADVDAVFDTYDADGGGCDERFELPPEVEGRPGGPEEGILVRYSKGRRGGLSSVR